MIKRLINWIRREDEIKTLRSDLNRLASTLNMAVSYYEKNLNEIKASMEVRDARDQMLVNAVVELQEKGVIYAN